MATGLEMFDALRQATSRLAARAEFKINDFDTEDLMRLSAADLARRGFDPSIAERVARDLAGGRLDELSAALNVPLRVDHDVKNLIPGEGLRRTAGVLANDGQTMEEMLEELDRIRHPERYPA